MTAAKMPPASSQRFRLDDGGAAAGHGGTDQGGGWGVPAGGP
jgi:hypothetical protein